MSNKDTRDRQTKFFLQFFTKPWFNNQCVAVGEFLLVQSFNPVTDHWQVAIFLPSTFPGIIHDQIELIAHPRRTR